MENEKKQKMETLLYESLNQKGYIDLSMIAIACETGEEMITESLQDELFCDPQKWTEKKKDCYVIKEEYLSGNILEKLAIARPLAEQYPHRFGKNVVALQNLLPQPPSFSDLYVSLGSVLLTPEMIENFIACLFDNQDGGKICQCKYIDPIKKWIVSSNYLLENSILATSTYGTKRMNVFKILSATLNHDPIQIVDYYQDYISKSFCKKINKKETILTLEKQKLLMAKFSQWLSDHFTVQQQIISRYYQMLMPYRYRVFKGNFLTFPEMNPKITLYPHQITAIERILFSKNTLLSHDVGSGKTYIMIAAGMKLKQFHPEMKLMYVVPNAILYQWRDDFSRLYPHSKIKVIRPCDFTPDKRNQQLLDIQKENYDAILLSYSSFELIPLDASFYIEELTKKKEELEKMVSEDEYNIPLSFLRSKEQKELRRNIRYIEVTIQHLLQKKEENYLCFNELKIDVLFIDEAHNFKNLPFETHLFNLRGLNPKGSNKCFHLYLKSKLVNKLIFATGTPIVNSISDLFIMQKYLWEEELKKMNLNSFDDWISIFGELTHEFEIDVDVNTYKQVSRFSRFHNLKQLSMLINQFVDFYSVKEEGLPKINQYQTIQLEKNPLQEQLLKEISNRIERIRFNLVPLKEDNLLKVTTDGRKLALDPRLISDSYQEERPNKISICAEKIMEIHQQFPGQAQLVFSDIGVVKDSFNVYDELKLMLLQRGFEQYEVQFIHEATSEEKKEKLFQQVRDGKVKVLIGSTAKMGIGVNVQDHLIALHHLDVPWRPSDMVQREGRILRQGNQNESVFLFRYVTHGTFDAYSWQILETKQNFISQLLSGCITWNDEDEIDGQTLSYAEIKALAIGDPSIKRRFELSNEINRLKILKKQEDIKKLELDNYLALLPFKIEELRKKITSMQQDMQVFSMQKDLEEKEKKKLNEMIWNTYQNTSENIEEVWITAYKTFDIFIPVSVTLSNPYLIVKGHTKHHIDFKDASTQIIERIQQYFLSLPHLINNKQEELTMLQNEKIQAEKELQMPDTYEESIHRLTLELNQLDKKLSEEDGL